MVKKKKIIIIAGITLLLVLIIVTTFMVIKSRQTGNGYYNNTKTENFVINDYLEDGNNERVKVILLSGQSNASGVSSTQYLKSNITEEEFEKYSNGFDNIYINYFVDNGNNTSNGFVKAGLNQGCLQGYFGPELGLAKKLSENTDEKVFIIKCSYSGTAISNLWNVKSYKFNEKRLYVAFKNFVKENIEYLKSKHYDIDIMSFCWMQGESDAINIVDAESYEKNLNNLVEAIRNDLKKYDNNIYFLDALIAEDTFWTYSKIVNEQKRQFADKSEYNIIIDTVSAKLTVHNEPLDNPDKAHYDSLSEIKLGELFANQILEILR